MHWIDLLKVLLVGGLVLLLTAPIPRAEEDLSPWKGRDQTKVPMLEDLSMQ
jgi:hypothetical protein